MVGGPGRAPGPAAAPRIGSCRGKEALGEGEAGMGWETAQVAGHWSALGGNSQICL